MRHRQPAPFLDILPSEVGPNSGTAFVDRQPAGPLSAKKALCYNSLGSLRSELAVLGRM